MLYTLILREYHISKKPGKTAISFFVPNTDVHKNISNSLKFFYHNCSGIRGKIKNLYLDAKSSNFDVLVLTETWLNDSFKNEEILDNKWTIFRKDRDYNATGLSRGGGVLIAVKSPLSAESVFTPSSSHHVEQNYIKINLDGKHVYIGVIYIPPKVDDSVYNTVLTTYLSIMNTLNDEDDIIIFGDFNRPKLSFITDEIDLELLPINFNDDVDFNLLSTFYSNDLHQVCPYPNSQGTWLDLIFTNAYNNISVLAAQDMENLFLNSLHHSATTLDYFTSNTKFSKSYNKNVVPDFKNADYNQINRRLATINWFDLLSNTDTDSSVNLFLNTLYKIIDDSVPKIIKKDKLSEPWLSKELRSLRNQRNKTYKKVKGGGILSPEAEQNYADVCIEYKAKSRSAYDEYVRKVGVDIIREPKKFFDFVNLKNKSSGYPSTMLNGQFSSSYPQVICDMFASRFQEVYSPPNTPLTDPTPVAPTVEIEPTTPDTPILINDIIMSYDDILNGLKNLDASKTPGPDHIPPIFLINCAQSLTVPLHIIFNNSIASGCFPSIWKTSFLVPIHKNGCKKDINNYRGIAILSTIPKLFEKIICDKISPMITPKLNEEQHGFRKGRSTTSNLMVYVSDLLCRLEAGHHVDAVYTDFSKAFDRVDHNILLSKVRKLGIHDPVLRWLSSYLSNRSQLVKFQGILSKEIKVLSGVPQGSHLGPLLFNIFIADLSESLAGIDHLFFADDLKIYHNIDSVSDTIFFQSKLHALENWCSANNLHLNTDKCFVITFTRKYSYTNTVYTLNKTILKRVDNIVDLGVLLDNKLSFKQHIDKMISRANKVLGFIKRRAKEFNNTWVTKALYCSLVRPILEYACPIWDPYYQCHTNRIESIQKQFLLFALREAYDPRNYELLPPYQNRLAALNIQTLSSRRLILTSCYAFDILTGRVNVDYLSERIKLNNDVRQTRHTGMLKTYQHRTDYAKNEPINRCCLTFNKHSQYFNPDISKSTFKNRISSSLSFPTT